VPEVWGCNMAGCQRQHDPLLPDVWMAVLSAGECSRGEAGPYRKDEIVQAGRPEVRRVQVSLRCGVFTEES
jgi:hypothetical protein